MTKVYLEWLDAYSADPWQSFDNAKKSCEELCVCYTIGWLLEETEEHITICHTRNDEQVTGCLHIPKRGIVKRVNYD